MKINGIRKIHQLSLTSEGIRCQKLSCLDCPGDRLCDSCQQLNIKFSTDKIENMLGVKRAEITNNNNDSDTDEEAPLEVTENIEDIDFDDHMDEHGDVEVGGGDGEDLVLQPGDVVWLSFNKRWIAAKIITLADVPDSSLTRQLKSRNDSSSLVKFYHDESFHRASNSRIELLGQNLLDQYRAKHHPAAYLEALSDVSYG